MAADNLEAVLVSFRRFEEFRLGILFLLNILKVEDLFRGLSHLAEAIIKAVLKEFDCKGLSVIALGKFGGREMTFGSDLDIIFVSETPEAVTAAEKVMKDRLAFRELKQSIEQATQGKGLQGLCKKIIVEDYFRTRYLKEK